MASPRCQCTGSEGSSGGSRMLAAVVPAPGSPRGVGGGGFSPVGERKEDI